MALARRSCYQDLLPFVVLVASESSDIGLFTLFKAASLKGMSHHVFVAYAFAVATIVLLPAPFFSHRLIKSASSTQFLHTIQNHSSWTDRVMALHLTLNHNSEGLSVLSPPLSVAVYRSLAQILGYAGISYSSPTLSSAISNLVPVFTFLLAIIFRMEKITVKSRSSQAKVLGSIISMSGAFVVTFYKGPSIINIHKSPTTFPLQQPISILNSADSRWAIGGLLLTAKYTLIPLQFIVQTEILKVYPDELNVVFFYNLYATIIGAIVGLLAETNASAWKIRLDMPLISIVCSGIFGKFLSGACHAWALRLKGPLYVAMFRPLSIVIAVAMGVMFLGDTLHIGSLVGGTIISIGFYTVMWGKATEEMEEDVGSLESTTTENVPLLHSYKTINS